MAVAVKVFVIEATRNGVLCVGTAARSRSAKPCPKHQASSPSATTAATTPGAVCVSTNPATAASRRGAIPMSHDSTSDPLEERDRLLQSVLEVGPRLPRDGGGGDGDVKSDSPQLARRQRAERGLSGEPDDLAQRREEVLHARLETGPHV